jgi:hypothetical protein
VKKTCSKRVAVTTNKKRNDRGNESLNWHILFKNAIYFKSLFFFFFFITLTLKNKTLNKTSKICKTYLVTLPNEMLLKLPTNLIFRTGGLA